MSYTFSFLIGYLFGSIPTAYLFLLWKKGLDITKFGSGNVGALNSFRVSKSKPLAATVFIIDLLKGLVSVLFIKYLYPNEYFLPMITLAAAVLGHCYSPWIRFKGGRGLATAAGGALLLSIPMLVQWIFWWLLSFFIKKNVHLASIAASLLTMIISIIAVNFFNVGSGIHALNNFEFGTSLSFVFIIILTKHM